MKNLTLIVFSVACFNVINSAAAAACDCPVSTFNVVRTYTQPVSFNVVHTLPVVSRTVTVDAVDPGCTDCQNVQPAAILNAATPNYNYSSVGGVRTFNSYGHNYNSVGVGCNTVGVGTHGFVGQNIVNVQNVSRSRFPFLGRGHATVTKTRTVTRTR